MKPFGIILLFLLFIGCSKEKRKAPEAFFIKPESISVAVTNATLQGTASSKITDLWYYVNGQFRGIFPVGNIFPIPSTGPTQITVYPGIKNNGISATRQPFEFYDAISIDTAVMPGTIVNRNFTFTYKSATKFHLIEGFEPGPTGTSIKTSNNSDTSFTILDKVTTPGASVYEGTRSFYFAVDDNKKVGQFESSFLYSLPKSGAPVYLEINYKCTQAFDVGIYSGSTYVYVASVNASADWNKIYIQLSSGVSTQPNSTCGLFFRAFRVTSLASSEFWIDNIKILSY